MRHVSAGPARPRTRPSMRWVTIVLVPLVAGCGSGGPQLPDVGDATVQDRQAELATTVAASTTRSWGAGYGRWTCAVRYLGPAIDSRTDVAWATCRSDGRVAGAFSAPVTVAGDTIAVAADGDSYERWVRDRFPTEIADLVLARDPAVMPRDSNSPAPGRMP